MLFLPTFGVVRSCSIFWSTAAMAERSTRPDSFAAWMETDTVRCSKSSCISILLPDKICNYKWETTALPGVPDHLLAGCVLKGFCRLLCLDFRMFQKRLYDGRRVVLFL